MGRIKTKGYKMKNILISILILIAFGFAQNRVKIQGNTNASVAEVIKGSLLVTPANSATTWLYVSNVGPTVLTASNVVVNQIVTNTVSVNTVASIPIIVSNILLSGQSGVWQIIVTNTVNAAVTEMPTVGVSNTTPFRVMVTNGFTLSDNQVNATNLLMFKDATHKALKMIDIVHAEIHAGNLFRVNVYSNSVADAGTFRVAFAATNKELHLFMQFTTTGSWTLYRYGSPVITNVNAASLKTAYNVNEGHSNTSSAWFSHAPQGLTNWGVVQGDPTFIPGNTGANRSAVNYQTTLEVVMQSNVSHLMVFSNLSGSTVPAGLQLFFYEE
jgi:hypothetical protein